MPSPLPDHGLSMTRSGVALVTESDGSIATGSTGLFVRDRRVVAGLRLTINGKPAVKLSRARVGPSIDRITYGYWDETSDPQAIIVRERSITEGYVEKLTVRCFRRPLKLLIEVQLEPGGATIYHLDDEEPSAADANVLKSSLWADGFTTEELTIAAEMAIDPGAEVEVSWGLTFDVTMAPARSFSKIETSNGGLQRALDRACWDLDALTIVDPATQIPFLAAGAPHFLAVFARDALIASLFAMIVDPSGALDTLDVLAAYQGKRHHEDTLEAPGAILHELRVGDMGVFGLQPGVPYYGSVDSTPLFVVLLAECLRWGAPTERLVPLLQPARDAVQWCRDHVDQFGFVQSVPHETGISNQGWKDSDDSVVRSNGDVLHEATSLCEVQGYFHQALKGLAEIEETIGDPENSAALLAEATTFAATFEDHFEIAGEVHVALALDASGQAVDVAASNCGHLLATGLISDATARRLADRMLSDDEFSGWGVRTLGASAAAFNPLGYHVGSVWPHDNAMLLRGLSLRGFRADTAKLAQALLDLAATANHTLPELLGGFDRSELPEPVPYPASARPQAWAAVVPFQIATSLLGLQPALHRDEILLRPTLDPTTSITINNLELGGRVISIAAVGRNATVTGDIDGLAITILT